MVVRASRGTLRAEDWTRAALEVLVAEGVAAVAVEPLAERLGATKGSFYHHFASRDDLITAALASWEAADEAVFARLELIADPRERLRSVMTAAFIDRDGGLRDASLMTSATHPLVRPVVDRVTDRRLKYMTDTFAATGFARPRARRRARQLYLGRIGLYTYLRTGLGKMTGVELRAYADELLDVLVPRATDRRQGRS